MIYRTASPLQSAPSVRMAGVTLIELVVTIGIMAILMAIATPSFQSITNSSRIASEINGLLGDLQYARSEAIKQGRSIVVCVSEDGVNCKNVTNWHVGWIMFFDADGNGAINNPESALRVQKKFSGTDTFQATNNITAITFNREGIAAGIANGTVIKLHSAPVNNYWTRCLSVTMVGQLQVGKYDGSNCT